MDVVEFETETVVFTVYNARRIDAREPFAMVDVEFQIAGVAIDILGIQARRRHDGGTAIVLPTFKDVGGAWRPAIRLPEEVHAPLTEAVLGFLLEQGLAKRKFAPEITLMPSSAGH